MKVKPALALARLIIYTLEQTNVDGYMNHVRRLKPSLVGNITAI